MSLVLQVSVFELHLCFLDIFLSFNDLKGCIYLVIFLIRFYVNSRQQQQKRKSSFEIRKVQGRCTEYR